MNRFLTRVPGLCLFLFLALGASSLSYSMEVTVFAPLRYTVGIEGTAVITDTVRVGKVVSGEFHLVVQNGLEGEGKADLAQVYLGKSRVAKLTSKDDGIDKKFTLRKDSAMRVELKGPRNSFIIVSIIAKKVARVPFVIRMSPANAQAALTAASLKIRKPSYAYHGYVRPGTVMSQTLKPGSYVKENSPAGITISKGPAKLYNVLPGKASTPASRAILDYDIDDRVAPSEIETIAPDVRVSRTSLLIAFTPDATVGQINGLITSLNGQITVMLKGVNQIIIRIPDPGSLANLDALINAYLTGNPIVRYVLKGTMPVMASLPPPIDPGNQFFGNITHQLDVRAHAAWNARSLIGSRVKPNVVVVDGFGDGPPNTDFAVVSLNPDEFKLGDRDQYGHGYHVLGVMAGTYGGDTVRGSVTGMFPGSGIDVLTLSAVDVQWGYTSLHIRAKLMELLEPLRASHEVGVILNTSLGYLCPSNDPLDKTCIGPGALSWLELVRGPALWPTGNTGPESLENVFLHVTAAGNAQAPGDTDAVMNSEWTAAKLLPGLVVPETGKPLLNLTNTLVIENRDQSPVLLGGTPGCLAPDSKFPGDLSAIGQHVFSLTGNSEFYYDWASGTSQATAQVGGLAAYLWTLKPGLTPQQIIGILANTADSTSCGGISGKPVIDAYAAVLALDRNYPDMEVRRAILDLNEDRVFNEKDVEKFLTEFDAGDGSKDFSRYDLNGDGQTGGTNKRSFNLDMDYPPTLGTVHQNIEGNDVRFDEKSLTDIEILCYYAYSPLYTGDKDWLKDNLSEKCRQEPTLELVYLFSGSVYSTDPSDCIYCHQTQIIGGNPPDLANDPALSFPATVATACPAYTGATTTFSQAGTGSLTVDYSGSSGRAIGPCGPTFDVGTLSQSVGQGRITAGTYAVSIAASPSFTPYRERHRQGAGVSFSAYFPDGGYRQITCIWPVGMFPDAQPDQCCDESPQGKTCGPAGSLSVDIDVPGGGISMWSAQTWVDSDQSPIPSENPADVSMSGPVLTVTPKTQKQRSVAP